MGQGTAYDVAAVRARFPALKDGSAHFDGPGGTQTPLPVIDAIAGALSRPLSNRGVVTAGERNAETIVAETRQALAGLGPRDEGPRRERLVSAFAVLDRHEDALRRVIEEGLSAFDQVTVHSRAPERTPTLLLTIDGRSTADAYWFLAERGMDTPSGSSYALEASRRLGLGDAGGLRVGLAPYNDAGDVDRLLRNLEAFLRRG